MSYRTTYVKVKVNLSLRLIILTPRHEDTWGSRGVARPFLTALTSGKQAPVPIVCRSGRYGGEISYFMEIEPRLLGRPARSLVAIPNEPSWLSI
jgi:hypothetical protein